MGCPIHVLRYRRETIAQLLCAFGANQYARCHYNGDVCGNFDIIMDHFSRFLVALYHSTRPMQYVTCSTHCSR